MVEKNDSSNYIVPGPDGEILRTILRKDVKEELTIFAQELATGMGKWDYGVAIERLLYLKNNTTKLLELEQRVEELEMINVGKETDKPNSNPMGLYGSQFKEE